MIRIVKGAKEHVDGVLKLVKELAAYEMAPDEVEVTKEELLHDGFGEHPAFEFFVALVNEEVVGIALYYFKYSTWKGKCIYLDDIVVTEKHRGKGIGEKLFNELIKLSKEMKVRKLEWQVLNWNEPALNFYKKFNALTDNEWINCKLTEQQINAWHEGI